MLDLEEEEREGLVPRRFGAGAAAAQNSTIRCITVRTILLILVALVCAYFAVYFSDSSYQHAATCMALLILGSMLSCIGFVVSGFIDFVAEVKRSDEDWYAGRLS